MTSLDALVTLIDAEPDVQTSVARLIDDLGARIKATSNDQNIQKLARDLARIAPDLIRAVAGKAPVG